MLNNIPSVDFSLKLFDRTLKIPLSNAGKLEVFLKRKKKEGYFMANRWSTNFFTFSVMVVILPNGKYHYYAHEL